MRNIIRWFMGTDEEDEAAAPPVDGDAARALQRRLDASSQTVSLRRLKKYGLQTVRVVDAGAIQTVVSEAIDEALRLRHADLTVEERAEVQDHANSRLMELVAENKELLAAKDEVERRGRELEAQVARLRAEIEGGQAELEEERQRIASLQQRIVVQIDDASFADMERRLQGVFTRILRDGDLARQEGGELIVPHLEVLEKELTALVTRVVSEVQARHLASGGASDEKLEMLELRIKKLNEALEQREEMLRQLAASKGYDPGIASIYDSIQGLDLEDLNYKKKTELLKLVFEENVELQEAYAAHKASQGEVQVHVSATVASSEVVGETGF